MKVFIARYIKYIHHRKIYKIWISKKNQITVEVFESVFSEFNVFHQKSDILQRMDV